MPSEDPFGERCDRIDDMLAGVEHQKHPLVLQMRDQARRCIVGADRQPQHGCDRRDRQIGCDERAEVEEEHGATEGLDQIVRDGDRDGGLADAAGADDRDEALRREQILDRADVVGAPDHAGQAAGQVRVRNIQRLGRGHGGEYRGRTAGPRDRCHEAVAAPGQGGDVARAILAVAQRLAQARHVKAQAAFFDRDIGPDLGQQIPLADGLVGTRCERDQDVESARAKVDGRAAFGEEPFARDQAERPER